MAAGVVAEEALKRWICRSAPPVRTYLPRLFKRATCTGPLCGVMVCCSQTGSSCSSPSLSIPAPTDRLLACAAQAKPSWWRRASERARFCNAEYLLSWRTCTTPLPSLPPGRGTVAMPCRAESQSGREERATGTVLRPRLSAIATESGRQGLGTPPPLALTAADRGTPPGRYARPSLGLGQSANDSASTPLVEGLAEQARLCKCRGFAGIDGHASPPSWLDARSPHTSVPTTKPMSASHHALSTSAPLSPSSALAHMPTLELATTYNTPPPPYLTYGWQPSQAIYPSPGSLIPPSPPRLIYLTHPSTVAAPPVLLLPPGDTIPLARIPVRPRCLLARPPAASVGTDHITAILFRRFIGNSN